LNFIPFDFFSCPHYQGFQLFLTSRIGHFQSTHINGTCHIKVRDFSDDELAQVCCDKQSPIANVVPKMVLCYLALKQRQNESDFGSRKRLFSIRDLKKWCNRCVSTEEITNENVVLEGLDCFSNFLPESAPSKIHLVKYLEIN